MRWVFWSVVFIGTLGLALVLWRRLQGDARKRFTEWSYGKFAGRDISELLEAVERMDEEEFSQLLRSEGISPFDGSGADQSNGSRGG